MQYVMRDPKFAASPHLRVSLSPILPFPHDDVPAQSEAPGGGRGTTTVPSPGALTGWASLDTIVDEAQ